MHFSLSVTRLLKNITKGRVSTFFSSSLFYYVSCQKWWLRYRPAQHWARDLADVTLLSIPFWHADSTSTWFIILPFMFFLLNYYFELIWLINCIPSIQSSIEEDGVVTFPSRLDGHRHHQAGGGSLFFFSQQHAPSIGSGSQAVYIQHSGIVRVRERKKKYQLLFILQSCGRRY